MDENISISGSSNFDIAKYFSSQKIKDMLTSGVAIRLYGTVMWQESTDTKMTHVKMSSSRIQTSMHNLVLFTQVTQTLQNLHKKKIDQNKTDD